VKEHDIMSTAVIPHDAEMARQKVATGALLRLREVAAILDVAPTTVHRLPLPSVRLGHSLRFDPADVRRLIESSKEPVVR
jgi:predicted DNA-binding transcriptional regulator AlpA